MNKTLLLAAAVTAAAFVTHGATAAPTGNPQTYGTLGAVTIGGAPFGTANGTGGVGEFDDTGGTGGIAAFKTLIATVTDLPALGGGTVTAEIAYDGTFVGTTFTSNGDTTTTFLSCTGDDIICDGVGAIGVPTPGSGGIPFSLDLCLGGTWSTTSLVGGVATLSTDHTSTGSPACAAPDAPTGLSATPGDGQATIDFTPGAANGTAITNHAYRVDGGPPTVLDPPQATGPVTITGLTNGTSYEITLRAINGSGESGSSAAVNVTPATAPDAPDAPTAIAGNSEASVTWTKPANNGGSTITGYTATSAPEDKICTTSGADDVTCDVTGLTNGTPYTFTVKATNALGTSADSTPSSSVTPLGAPDAPTGLLQQGEADNVATIAFTPGADNGAAITNYAYGLDGGSYTALDPAQPNSPVTITGLTNDQPYSITLKAINSEGESAAASGPIVVTPGQPAVVTPPDAPTGLSATPGDGEATITFTPGALNGAAITNYAYSVDGVDYAPLSPASAGSPITITGLTNGTPYSITLKAINSAGESAAASAAVEVTPVAAATAPDAPTGLSATPGNGQATIAFTPGADNGAAITNYEYSLDGGSYTPLSPASAGSPITIVGLTNDTPYSITLRAINSAGSSAVASDAVVTTPVGPAPPSPYIPPGPAAPIPTLSAYGLGLTVLGVFVVAVRRLRTSAKLK